MHFFFPQSVSLQKCSLGLCKSLMRSHWCYSQRKPVLNMHFRNVRHFAFNWTFCGKTLIMLSTPGAQASGIQDGGPFISMSLLTQTAKRSLTSAFMAERAWAVVPLPITWSVWPIRTIRKNVTQSITASQNELRHSSVYDIVTSRWE